MASRFNVTQTVSPLHLHLPCSKFSVMFKRKVLKTELHIIMKLKNRNDTILFDMGHRFVIFGSEMILGIVKK